MTPEQNVHDDFLDFLKALNDHQVEYMVIGGHAVGFHGRPRDTGDMDIAIKPTADNAERVVKAVAAFGAGNVGYTKEDYLSGDFIQFGVAPVRIDVTITFAGVDQARLWQDAVQGSLGGVPVKFPSKECLLENKRQAGRDKDLRDIEALSAEDIKKQQRSKDKSPGFEP